MLLKVKYFARLSEIAGKKEETIELSEGSTVIDLKKAMFGLHPGLSSYQNSLIVACNEQFASDSRKVTSEDSIDIFPPVSGG